MITKHNVNVVRSSNSDLLAVIRTFFEENNFLLLELDMSLASPVKFEEKIIESVLLVRSENRIYGFIKLEGKMTPLIDGSDLRIHFKKNFSAKHEGVSNFLVLVGVLIEEICMS